jgi:hypothetical protein
VRHFSEQRPREILSNSPAFFMVSEIVCQVTPLAKRLQIIVAVVARYVIQMSDRQNDSDLAH